MKLKVLFGAFALGALALLSRPIMAAVSTPQDLEGHTIPTSDWAGAFPCYIDNSNSTNAIECSSSTASLGLKTFDTTGRGELIGVIFSSMSANNFLVFRDTQNATVVGATMTMVGPYTNPSTTFVTGQTIIYKFPVPIQYQSGLSVNAAVAIPAGGSATIIYRPFKQID